MEAHTRRVWRIHLADQSIMWLGAVTKGVHVANTFPVSRGAICGQTQSLIKIHTEPALLRWVGRCSIKMSLQQGYLHPLACISLTLSSPMPGPHNGRLLYSRWGPFPPFPARSGPNPRGVLTLCLSELGSNCFKWGGLVKHLLRRAQCVGVRLIYAQSCCAQLSGHSVCTILDSMFDKSRVCVAVNQKKKNPTA